MTETFSLMPDLKALKCYFKELKVGLKYFARDDTYQRKM